MDRNSMSVDIIVNKPAQHYNSTDQPTMSDLLESHTDEEANGKKSSKKYCNYVTVKLTRCGITDLLI